MICLLAAYLLIPLDGRVSPLLVSVAAQMGAQRNVMPLVLAETLLGLALVYTDQTDTFSGSPLLLQVNSPSSPFFDFHTFSFYLNSQLGLLLASYLFFRSGLFGFLLVFSLIQLWLSDKIGLLHPPEAGWNLFSKRIHQRQMRFPEMDLEGWYEFMNHMKPDEIAWRCT